MRKFHVALAAAPAPLFLPLLLLLALLLSSAAARAASEHTFSVGIVPQFEIRQIYAIWTPILDELQQRTGYRFQLSGSPSIPEFEKQFSAGLFDFAYMNPYHLLLANNRQGYVPLVRDVGADLQGILVVKKGGVKKLSELEGRSIAFPAPNSLAASLLLRAELSDKFRIKHHSVYVKSHSSVYLNVLLGLAAAGGGVQRTLEQQPQDIRDGLEILYRTEGLAPHPFTAHPRVAANIRTQVQQALLDFAATSRGQALLAKLPIERLGVASYDDYAPIARLGLDRFYLPE